MNRFSNSVGSIGPRIMVDHGGGVFSEIASIVNVMDHVHAGAFGEATRNGSSVGYVSGGETCPSA